MSGISALQKTSGAKWVFALRMIAGAPLAVFGAMHLVGAMPMEPLLEAAGIPAPGLMAIVAPLIQLVAGLLLLTGALARIGGVLGVAAMAGAIVTHVKIPNDAWPDPENAGQVMEEPVAMLGIAGAILVFSLVVLIVGAGKWSLDAKMTSASPAGGTEAP